MSHHPTGINTEDEPLDLTAALRIVEDAERSARRQLAGNGALIYLVWGAAWIAGYGALEGSRKRWLSLEPEAALIVLGVSLAVATLVTVAVFIQSSRGIRGNNAFQGSMYGASWALGFLVMGILSARIGREIEDFWLRGMLINSIAVLIVGLLYITGGAAFNDRRQCFLGVWLLLVTAAALVAGSEYFLTVFLYLGSGGMLAGAAAEFLATRKRKPGAARA